MQTIVGVLTKEPEIRYTQDGLARTTMYVQENYSGNTLQILCEGILAENVALSLTKGDGVITEIEEEPVVYHTHSVGVTLYLATASVNRNSDKWEED